MGLLYNKSLQIIKEGQSESGAYIASPNFPTYHYCWLRDGSFIAHAMDTGCEFSSAAAYFRWVGRAILKYSAKVDRVRQRLAMGDFIGKDDVLHTRYTLDGKEETTDSSWGNFQIDGYGTWLWALTEHVKLSGDAAILKELREPILITLRYLELVWTLPNYDCWEENPMFLHPYSLASVYAGFNSISSLIHTRFMEPCEIDVDHLSQTVKDFILKFALHNGRLVKHIWPEGKNETPKPVKKSGVDSSLISMVVPYNIFPFDDPIMQSTLNAIEADLLRPGGGVYRYKADVYYGGGEWILLTAWLGWYYAKVGKIERAVSLRSWIESQMDADGFLPEQVSNYTLAPAEYKPWFEKWGKVANPLLWSHAMYIILVNAIKKGKAK